MVCVYYLWCYKHVFHSVSRHHCARNDYLKTPISVFSCYTPELLCGSSSSRCTLIAYGDGGSAKEKCKLRNVHCMYSTQVQSVFMFMLTTLCTLPRYFVYNLIFSSTTFSCYHEYPFTIITLYSEH